MNQTEINELGRATRSGDKVIVKKAKSSTQLKTVEGQLVTVEETRPSGNDYLKATTKENTTVYIYFGHSGYYDEFTKLTRKEIAETLEDELKKVLRKADEIKKEIEFYKKYESDEEFVAEKIDKLMKTKGVKAKAEILKELKKSNLL